MSWKATVWRVDNGFIVRHDGNEVVFAVAQGEELTSAGYDMLWELIQIFDLRGSRYDKNRLRVVMEQGDKFLDSVELKEYLEKQKETTDAE